MYSLLNVIYFSERKLTVPKVLNIKMPQLDDPVFVLVSIRR